MSALRSLPVLMPDLPQQKWSCHSCGACCRVLVGHLFDDDRRRLDEQGWQDKLDVPPYVRLGKGWALNKRADGACVFLTDDGLCRIHVERGEEAKPLACRIFPYSMRQTRGGWQVSLRFDCPSVTSSKGTPVRDRRAWLGELATVLAKSQKGSDAPQPTYFKRGLEATPDEVDEVVNRFARAIAHGDGSVRHRLIGLARLTGTLMTASLDKVRGKRFCELLDLLFGTLPGEAALPAQPPSTRQRAMVRQLAFAHAEYVTLHQARWGAARRVTARFYQLRRARRFRVGRGEVPPILGIDGRAAFDVVESVGIDDECREAVEDLLVRYVTARLRGRAVFGDGYYGWPVFPGLAALWLSLATVGWLARYAAAAGGRAAAGFDDVACALGIVDRSATRLPALGTLAERARVLFMARDDGIARVLGAYAPLPRVDVAEGTG